MYFTSDLFAVAKFAVYLSIDDNEILYACSEDEKTIIVVYSDLVRKYLYKADNHIIIRVYDFDKDANIEYYDSELDL